MKVIKKETSVSFKRIPVISVIATKLLHSLALCIQQGEELASLLILTDVGLGNQSGSGIINGDVNRRQEHHGVPDAINNYTAMPVQRLLHIGSINAFDM